MELESEITYTVKEIPELDSIIQQKVGIIFSSEEIMQHGAKITQLMEKKMLLKGKIIL